MSRSTACRVLALITLVVFLAVPQAIGADGLPNLEGRWAMVQVYAEIAVLPFAGEVSRTSTVGLFTELSQEETVLSMSDTYCFSLVDDGTSLVSTTIPDAFIASLAPLLRTGRIVVSDDGFGFTTETYVEVRGALLDHPEDDPLPTDAEDARIIDQDGDGHPGMTVRVTILGLVEGETYVVQRVRYRLSGRIVGNDTIVGTIEWQDEQTVLGASNPMLLAQTSGSQDPDTAKHRFVMVRVDADWTCATLHDRVAELLETEAP